VRWLEGVGKRDEDIRYALQRASTTFVPVVRPAIRYHYSIWEESKGRIAVARAILKSLTIKMPQLVSTYVYLAHLERRVNGFEAGIASIKDSLASGKLDIYTSGALVAEWAKMIWRVKGDISEARNIFDSHADEYLDSKYFWIDYFKFELQQPLDTTDPEITHNRVANVYKQINERARLPPLTVRDITEEYMQYLLDRRTGLVDQYILLDRETNGPFIVQTQRKRRLADDGNVESVNKRIRLTNGHPGVEVDEEALKANKLDGVFEKYYADQGEVPPVSNGAVLSAALYADSRLRLLRDIHNTYVIGGDKP
jgi:pre-mRNA-processing factor 39